MHTWAPYNPEDHRMSARRLLSAWSVVALCALAVAVLSAISGTETAATELVGALEKCRAWFGRRKYVSATWSVYGRGHPGKRGFGPRRVPMLLDGYPFRKIIFEKVSMTPTRHATMTSRHLARAYFQHSIRTV